MSDLSPDPYSSEDLHTKAKEEEVAIAKLRVDPSYQRTANQDFVDELARDWDVVKAELPLISWRGARTNDDAVEGGYWIVSGQHRVRAAHKLGMKTIFCRVIDLSKAEDPAAIEAYYRLGTNKRISDRSADAFKAKLRMGDPSVVAIVKIVNRYDGEINLNTPDPDHGINATSALELIYRKDDGATLSETLALLKGVYGELNPRSSGSDMMKGISWFIDSHALDADRGRLAEKMEMWTPSQILARATQMQSIQGKARWMNLYMVLVDMYNEKLADGKKLQINLRGGSTSKPSPQKRRGPRS